MWIFLSVLFSFSKSFTDSMILGDILYILILWDPFGKPYLYEKVISKNNGNRTEWSPVWSVIIWVISKIGWPCSGSPVCLIKGMITDRIGQHKVLLPINRNYKNLWWSSLFLTIKTQEIPRVFSLAVKKKPFKCMHAMMHTVLLHRHDAYVCPITLSWMLKSEQLIANQIYEFCYRLLLFCLLSKL